jgi:hypothetical protein
MPKKKKKSVRLSLISKEFSDIICGFGILLDMNTPGVSASSYTSTLHPSSLRNMLQPLLLLTLFSSLHM